MTKRTALNFIANEPWAIREEWMDTICSIAVREHEYANDVVALEQRLGRPLSNTQATMVRDGVAIIPVSGPLFRHANMMTELSGATSYDMLSKDLRAAVEDSTIKAIILNIDSPGGAVKGANELSKQIASVRGIKPIVAYVDGDAASAAYWLASAADEIVADEAATIGSIGAMIGVRLSENRPGEKAYSFVSSQSPLKNASPDTDQGARELQRLTDELAQVFIDTVAKNRGITSDTVLANYGQGAVFAGEAAFERGMVDSLGTFEALLSRLSGKSTNLGAKTQGVYSMTPQELAAQFKAEHPEAATVLLAEGSEGERARIQAVRAQSLKGHEALVETLAFDGVTTGAEAAIQILAAERSKVETAGEARASDAPAPVAQDAAEADADDAVASAESPVHGYSVDAKRVSLDAKAKAYMAANNCDYVTAIKAIQSDKGV